MNYLKEINAFHDEVELNEVSASASLLWYVLMQFNNKTGWKEEFTVPTAAVLVKSAMSEKMFLRARKELAEKGYLSFRSGSRHSSPSYTMISCVKEAGGADKREDSREGVEGDFIKRKERRGKEEPGRPHLFYEQNVGTLSPHVAERITAWAEELPDDVVTSAMGVAVENNKRSFRYIESILKNWQARGVRSLADVEREERRPREEADRASVWMAMYEEKREETVG